MSMTITVRIKEKEKKLFYQNVTGITTSVDFINKEPMYKMRLHSGSKCEDVYIENIIDFEIEESLPVWIKYDDKKIECPYCRATFRKSILTAAGRDVSLRYCPSCARAVRYEDVMWH